MSWTSGLDAFSARGIVYGTTRPPYRNNSQRIGRPNVKLPFPSSSRASQFICLGNARPRSRPVINSGNASTALLPRTRLWKARYSPLAVVTLAIWSNSTPCFFAKPRAAGVGWPSFKAAETGGPVMVSSRSSWRSAIFPILTVRRRGVLKLSMAASGASRSSLRRAPTTSRSCRSRFGSHDAGSSSTPISMRSSLSINSYKPTLHGPRSQPRSAQRAHRSQSQRPETNVLVFSFVSLVFLVSLELRSRQRVRVGLFRLVQPRPPLRDRHRHLANPEDVGHSFGHADAAARVEQVEHVRTLQAVIERRQHQVAAKQRLAQAVVLIEEVPVQRVQFGGRHVDLPERILRLLDLIPMPHIAVFHVVRPFQVEDVVHILQRHRKSFESVGELHRYRGEIDTTGLLEVGELGDLLAVEEDLPADPPRTERWRFPIVF